MHTEEEYRDSQVKDRPFDPAKVPASPAMWAFVDEVDDLLAQAEARVRRRKPAAQTIYRQALSALLADLVHRQIAAPDAWVTVELSKKNLSPATRRAPFMTEAFISLVKLMEAAGVIELDLGFRIQFAAVRSRVRASLALVRRIDELGLEFSDVGQNLDLMGDPIVLKGEKVGDEAPRLPVPDTEEVRRLRREMTAINAWIGGADIAWEEDDYEVPVDTGRRFLERIFNDARFDRGGRLFGGFWEKLSSDRRLRCLRIDGEQVASVDFKSMSVRLAYAEMGADPPEGDLYAHRWYPRDGVKLVLNSVLSVSAPLRRMPDGARAYFKRSTRIDDVVAELERGHPAIRPLFFQANSKKFMYQESQIIVRALLALQEAGVVAIPLHDCLVVGRSRVDVAKEVLRRASLDVVGVEIPVDVSTSPDA